ncbi:hypothetical protein NSTC745_06421 [Nostoc sp. DSM 114161]|jgi:hypothetical protein|uniref:hypothetical protein n=1 Tax=Nostoc sp. DSM 114161 TaxID=3440143 RepID=UPI0040457725
MTTTCEPPKQISLFALRWKPQKGQPIPWDIKQRLCKPKGGRNKKGDFDNFHNRDYDFVSPRGEVFVGKGFVGLLKNTDCVNPRFVVFLMAGYTVTKDGQKLLAAGNYLCPRLTTSYHHPEKFTPQPA